MKTTHAAAFVCAGLLLCGCTAMPRQPATPVMATADYATQEPIATSLFPSDQAVLNDAAVTQILSSKLELPVRAKVALMRFSDLEGARSYGRYYWRDEEYLKLQQAHVDALIEALKASDQIAEATPLPSLMIPSRPSIPLLREAAVRMQADLLLVFRVGSDIYSQYRTFSKDRVKSYSTCELVLLDIRTGLVPFTRVVSREQLELQKPEDFDLSETMRRAKQVSAAATLKVAADDLVSFLKSVPKKTR